MCSDENSAPHAAEYLNAQLAVLHKNAQDCLEQHVQARTEENSTSLSFLCIVAIGAEHGYTGHFYALAEFTVYKPSHGSVDTAFHATFDNPRLEFICDHDVILHLKLKTGHLILDSSRPGRNGCVLHFFHVHPLLISVGGLLKAKVSCYHLTLRFPIGSPSRPVASSVTM